jgi:hypothetical protein
MLENPKAVWDTALSRVYLPKDMQALMECGFKERKFSEVARELGVTPTTTSNHYWRALRYMTRSRELRPHQVHRAAKFFFFDKIARDIEKRWPHVLHYDENGNYLEEPDDHVKKWRLEESRIAEEEVYQKLVRSGYFTLTRDH